MTMLAPTVVEVEGALSFVESDDREIWIRVGAALKTVFDERGFAMWDSWSRSSSKYERRVMRSQWRSLRRGRVGAGTIFFLAQARGWKPAEGDPEGTLPRPQPKASTSADIARRDEIARHEAVAQEAVNIVQDAKTGTGHPYMTSKGFPEQEVLIRNPYHTRDSLEGEVMIVPIWTQTGNKVQSLQFIDEQGTKRFLPGGKVKGGCFRISRGRELWLVEGYATGLSVSVALRMLYRDAEVVVAFSASNMVTFGKRCMVVADNDPNGVGHRYAKATGYPWWSPPEHGDANDLHQQYGIRVLVGYLRDFISGVSL